MKKHLLITICFIAGFLVLPGIAEAQDLATPARNFLTTTLRPLYPIVLAGVLLITGLYNIGMVTKGNDDWKGFFTRIGLFLGGAILLGVAIEAVYAFSVNF